MTKQTSKASEPPTKWLAIRTGAGRMTGHIEGFRTAGGKYVTIPGVSRFRAAQNEPVASAWPLTPRRAAQILKENGS
jgi:hypothetical protein